MSPGQKKGLESILRRTALEEGQGKLPKGSTAGLAAEMGLPPPPVDYTALEEKKAEKNFEFANPDQYTDEGMVESGINPETGNPFVRTTLNPDLQAARTAQNNVTRERSEYARDLLGNVQSAYANPMDWGSLPQAPDAQGARDQAISSAYNQATSRLDPQWNQREEATRSQLLNQGFQLGDEGYQKAMANLGLERNDAYSSAMNGAIGQGTSAMQALFGMGQNERQQGLTEMLQQRNQPLNELNALLTGQQVANPQMPSFNGVAGADYTGAARMGRQDGIDASNAAAAQSAANDPVNIALKVAPYAAMLSDERLKEGIQRLPYEAAPGIPLAVFAYKGDPQRYVGVIAQDVEKVQPGEVVTGEDGFLRVSAKFAPVKI